MILSFKTWIKWPSMLTATTSYIHNPADSTTEMQVVAAIVNYIYGVSTWMGNNKLLLNEEKTEL